MSVLGGFVLRELLPVQRSPRWEVNSVRGQGQQRRAGGDRPQTPIPQHPSVSNLPCPYFDPQGGFFVSFVFLILWSLPSLCRTGVRERLGGHPADCQSQPTTLRKCSELALPNMILKPFLGLATITQTTS